MVVKDKVAFVTGGSRGIGLAMVKKLIQNGAKAVAVVDVLEADGQKAVKEFGNKALFIKADVANAKELEAALEKTVQTFKQLDIVVNNAGVINEVDWEKTIAINMTAVVRGTYLAMEKYLPKYKSGDEGVIVNVASILGLGTIQSIPTYCATKHAVVGLGEALGGDEYTKKYKVRVLTLCPGLIETPMIHVGSDKVVLAEKAKTELGGLNTETQTADNTGEALIKIIKEGKTGALWVTEENKPPYEVKIPHWKNMRKK